MFESDAEQAEHLGVSEDAVVLARESEIIDLHLDTFIPRRMFGYDPSRPHGGGPLMGRMFGHVDFPRAQAGHLTGGMWSITTNPFRSGRGRWTTFLKNLESARRFVDDADGVEVVRTHAEYRAARARGAHACMLAVQGGNALDEAPAGVADIPDRLITRVTLLHLTNSRLGATSSPFPLSWGLSTQLTPLGRERVEQMDEQRVFVDLAHIHPKAFWDAVDAHDPSLPLIDTHTGVSGVKKSWRNLDDDQLRAIADTGGVVGIIFHGEFLKRPGGPRDGRMIVEHAEYVIDVLGEDFVALGSDFDGAILPPRDLTSALCYPRIVHYMLERSWSETRIRKVLGLNFLRAFEQMRPE